MPPLRAVWVDEGNQPNWPLLTRHNMTHVYLSARGEREGITAASFDAIRARGFHAGIYHGHSWDAGLDGAQTAELMNRCWLKFEGAKKRLDVQFNIEQHDPEFIVELLARWRQLRPWAGTSWTMEGFQGGWMVEIREQIVASRVLLVPQNYGGDMTSWDSYATVMDLVNYGFPLERIRPFYDAAKLARGWDGFAFTMNRLPG